jgi:hypothetical protein
MLKVKENCLGYNLVQLIQLSVAKVNLPGDLPGAADLIVSRPGTVALSRVLLGRAVPVVYMCRKKDPTVSGPGKFV